MIQERAYKGIAVKVRGTGYILSALHEESCLLPRNGKIVRFSGQFDSEFLLMRALDLSIKQCRFEILVKNAFFTGMSSMKPKLKRKKFVYKRWRFIGENGTSRLIFDTDNFFPNAQELVDKTNTESCNKTLQFIERNKADINFQECFGHAYELGRQYMSLHQ